MFGESEYPKVFVYRGKEWQTGNLLFYRPEHGPSIEVRVNKRKLSLDPNMARQSSGLARAMPWVVRIPDRIGVSHPTLFIVDIP